MTSLQGNLQGRIQDFKLGGGGGGGDLKKLRRVEGDTTFFGVFRVKNHDFMPKIIFFPILGGVRAGCAPPGSVPDLLVVFYCLSASEFWPDEKMRRKRGDL